MYIKLETEQNLEELKKQTLINILSVKGIIYTHYKNKQLKQRGKNDTKQIRRMGTNG